MSRSKQELELENRLLREMLSGKIRRTETQAAPKKKQIMYQCRYCGYQSVRNATEGVPLPGVNNCPRHPRGVHKGPHSWMRTYL